MATDIAMFGIGIDARKAKQGADVVDKSFRKAGRAADGATRKLDRTQKKMDRTKVAAMGLKRAMAGIFVGMGVGLAIRSITKINANFDETMRVIAGVTNNVDLAGDQMQKIEKVARTLGATTRFSANQAADAMLTLARAGFTAEQSIAASGPVLDFAVAGQLELQQAAEITATTLGQFSLKIEDAAHAQDVLVNSANRAKTDVGQMAEAFKLVGSVASSTGISLENTAGAIGVLADRGLEASMAGTNLRGMIAQLLDPSTKAQKTFKAMGIDMAKMNPLTNDLSDIFEELARVGLDAGEAVRIFGRRNFNAALTIVESTEKMKELTAANKEIAGLSRRNARLLDEGITGSLKSFVSVVQEATLVIGREGGFNSTLQTMLDTATGAIRIFVGMANTIEGGPTRAMKNLALGVEVVGLGLVALTAMKVVPWFLTFATGASTATLAVQSLALSILSLMAIVGAAVSGISFGRYLFDEFRLVQEGAAKFIEWFGGAWNSAISNMRYVWIWFKNAFTGDINKLTEIWADWVFDMANLVDIFNSDLAIKMKKSAKAMELPFENVTFDSVRKEYLDVDEEWRNAMERTAAIFAMDMADIERQFGDAQTAGRDFGDGVKASALNALGSLEELRDTLLEMTTLSAPGTLTGTDATGGAFAPESSGLGGELHGVADGLRDVGEAAADVKDEIAEFEGNLNSAFGSFMDNLNDASGAIRGLIEDLLESMVVRPATEGLATALAQWIGPLLGLTAGNSTILAANTAAITANTAALLTGAALGAAGGGGTTTGAAKGRVFSYAAGGIPTGVIDRPTTFSMAGGNTGLVGEAGREVGFAPLTKTPSGELAVKQVGGGGVTVNAPITILTNNPDEFHASKLQIMSDIKRGIRRSFEEVR